MTPKRPPFDKNESAAPMPTGPDTENRYASL
jgi:hypothetical protein